MYVCIVIMKFNSDKMIYVSVCVAVKIDDKSGRTLPLERDAHADKLKLVRDQSLQRTGWLIPLIFVFAVIVVVFYAYNRLRQLFFLVFFAFLARSACLPKGIDIFFSTGLSL